ncbi:hypothetical protein ASC94_20300 [Massilia sp. Root418]|uniref:DUF4198 domain-containing protein n=1 Tax=Massilia sp. Root418 TaxID=1736532 RepID=UPI0006F8E535|nr:DUF4198 domain-containing protein [Massilia sp. Root418]KQW90088.1 hypothetical protein ASC94_20300 [Massilia sp. Root418]
MTAIIHRITAPLLLSCALAPPAAAHDFWIQPDNFFPASGTTTALRLLVGHGEARQPSALPARRVKRLTVHAPGGASEDVQPAAGAASFQPRGSGAHMVALETDDQAQSHLPAARFNSYLREEGLMAAFSYRARNRLMNEDGAERYSRVAKALVDSGPPGRGDQQLATAALGLPLEIVLGCSPSQQPRPDLLPVTVMFHGQPLPGALVKLTDLDHDSHALERQLSDSDGRANFMMPGPGRWLLNVVWTTPAARGDGTDYETVFSSLSFGVRTDYVMTTKQ